ncbi:NAD(P)H-quinone oxidoreductase [Georgenia deserti]|uniref:NAD(P)H-quinone oxidoreductase n=1 Tax=Georgenia deserti TaxID=2093781 RepID=A0ABW4L1P7_9MICO
MRAIAVGPDQRLALTEVPDPEPGPGELLIDVAAAGVNRADLLQRAGHYPPPPGASDILGLEVSGTVAGLGDGVSGWQVGQEVCALLTGGGYAERVAVPAGQVLPVPEGVGLVEAAGLPEAVCTAWSNLVDVAGMRTGDTVLIHGGSGGVGSVAVQLATALGARVLATAGGAERAERCRDLGVEVAIDHRAEDVVDAVHSATDRRGVDVLLDVLGAGALEDNVRCLAADGRLVVIGLQQGRRGEIDLGRMLAKRASLHATTLRSRPPAEKAALVAEVREAVWPMLHDGRVRPVVDRRVPLADAETAHELLESGQVFGTVVLTR